MKSQYFCTKLHIKPAAPAAPGERPAQPRCQKNGGADGKLWILLARRKIYVNPMVGNGTFQAARAGRRRWEFGKSQALNAHNFSLLVLSNFDNPTWPPSYPMVGSLCIFLFSSPCSALLTPSPLECLLCCFFLLRAQSDLSQALPEHDLTALVP